MVCEDPTVLNDPCSVPEYSEEFTQTSGGDLMGVVRQGGGDEGTVPMEFIVGNAHESAGDVDENSEKLNGRGGRGELVVCQRNAQLAKDVKHDVVIPLSVFRGGGEEEVVGVSEDVLNSLVAYHLSDGF
jgi:hypothetical protein